MKPLSLLSVNNFQNHECTEVELSPTVTVFVGPSDTGKSAMLRALAWLAFNRPSGDAFIRNGSKIAEASIVTGKHTISRKRGKDRNQYELDGEAFKAMGDSVPTPIQDILKIKAINYQDQLSAPFWFMLSPGQVSKNLNDIVNLSAIDDILAACASKIRTASTEGTILSARIAEAKKKIAETKWAVKASRELEEIKKIQDKASKMELDNHELSEWIELIENLSIEKKRLEPIKEAVKEMHALEEQRKKADDFAESNRHLSMAIDRIKELARKKCECKEKLEAAQKELAKAPKGKVCPKCGQRLSSVPIST